MVRYRAVCTIMVRVTGLPVFKQLWHNDFLASFCWHTFC